MEIYQIQGIGYLMVFSWLLAAAGVFAATKVRLRDFADALEKAAPFIFAIITLQACGFAALMPKLVISMYPEPPPTSLFMDIYTVLVVVVPWFIGLVGLQLAVSHWRTRKPVVVQTAYHD